MRFPSISDVAAALREVNDETRRMNGKGDCDVRLQIYPDGGWAVRWGLSDYDQDHRGFWGASSVPGGRFDSVSTARDLLSQARDSHAQSE